MKKPQELATRVFITASALFGITGITMLIITPDGDPAGWIGKVLGVLAFTILSSFGVSVGYKYLSK
ncbi:MAG TPA: hypothetical protein VLE69_03330 [Candidatus Saccharimonadales bacterium]|nr:hypothetical protein [Candidatus Saccharimonadales bacterium]